MKVRAKQTGQYKGRTYDPGAVFEIEDGTYPVYAVDDHSRPVLKDGKPVVSEQRPHLEHWMEEIKEETFLHKIFHPKSNEEKRSEPRDPGESDQHYAERLGLAEPVK